MNRLKEDFDYFYGEHSIRVIIPISKKFGKKKDVKIGCNKKIDFKPDRILHNQIEKIELQDIFEEVDRGICGFAIRTGKINNITIIDIDNIKDFSLLERLNELNTLTIKSPRGFHFYFKYEPSLINRIGVITGVDIRNDNGIGFYGDRDDGSYKIINKTDIKELSTELIEIFKEKSCDTNQPEQTQISLKADINEDDLDDTKINERWFITEKGLFQIVKELPQSTNDNYEDWYEILRTLKKENYFKVLDLWSKQSFKYDYKNNVKLYNVCDVSNHKEDLNSIVKKVNEYKKSKKEPELKYISKIYKEYLPLSIINKDKITKKINQNHLTYDLYDKEKNTIEQSPLGTGKTTSKIDYLIKNKEKAIVIVPLRATTRDHYENFKNKGLDVVHYSDFNIIKNKKHYKRLLKEKITNEEIEQLNKDLDEINTDKIMICENIECAEDEIKISKNTSIIVCIDSILKIKEVLRKDKHKEYVLFLDEIHSLIKYIYKCENISKNRKMLISYLFKLVKECKKIFMSDGVICNNAIKILEKANKEYEFIYNSFKQSKDKNCVFVFKFIDVVEKMFNDMCNGIYWTCCCNTKSDVNRLQTLLNAKILDFNKTAINKIDPTKLLIYTSTHGEEVINANKDWLSRWVIYSPKIVSGVDFSPKDDNIYNTYSFISGNQTLNPEETIQQINRNRKINELFIYVEKMSNNLQYKNKEHLRYYLNDIKESYENDDIFNSLCDNIDNNGEVSLTENIHTDIYLELVYQENILNSSYEYILYQKLKSQGFNITLTLNKSKGLSTKDKKYLNDIYYDKNTKHYDRLVNDKLLESDDNTFTKVINELIKSFNIDTDEKKEKYKHLICEPKLIKQHFLLRLLLYDMRSLEVLNKKKDINEIEIVAFKDNITSIMILKKVLKEYLNINDFSCYKYNTAIDKDLEDEISFNDYYYKHIISITKSTKKPPKTKKDLYELLNVYINHILLGQTIYHDENTKPLLINIRKVKKIDGKAKTFQEYYINNSLMDIQIDLFKDNLYERHLKDIDDTYLYLFTDKNIKEDEKITHYKNEIKEVLKEKIKVNDKIDSIILTPQERLLKTNIKQEKEIKKIKSNTKNNLEGFKEYFVYEDVFYLNTDENIKMIRENYDVDFKPLFIEYKYC